MGTVEYLKQRGVWRLVTLLVCLLPVVLLWGCGGGSSGGAQTSGNNFSITGAITFPAGNAAGKAVAAATTTPTVEVRDLNGALKATVTATGAGTGANPYRYTVTGLAKGDYVVRAVNGAQVLRGLVDQGSLSTTTTKDIGAVAATAVIVVEKKIGLTPGTLGAAGNSATAAQIAALQPATLDTAINTALADAAAGTADSGQVALANLTNIVTAAVSTNVDPSAFVAGTSTTTTSVSAPQYAVGSGTATTTTVTATSAGTIANNAKSAVTADIAIAQGVYNGTYTGTDSGTFTIAVDATGNVQGTSNTNSSITGTITLGGPDGLTFVFSGTVNGTNTISGIYNPATKIMSGTWNDPNDGSHGTFTVSFATTTPVSYTATVYDYSGASGIPAGGVTVTTIGLAPQISTTTNTAGSFTLANIPSGIRFYIKLSKSGYADSYSGYMNYNANTDTSTRPYALWQPATLSAWGNTAGKGIIRSRVVESTNQDTGYISGAVVTATDGNGTSYPVNYLDSSDNIISGAAATDATGKYLVLNVPAGRIVNVTATKSGYTFNTRTFVVYADSVSQQRVVGTSSGPPSTGTPPATLAGKTWVSNIATTPTFVTFIDATNYLHIQTSVSPGDTSIQPGVEQGTYSYDPQTGNFKVTAVTIDTNLHAGLSDSLGKNPAGKVLVNGSTYTFTDATDGSVRTLTLLSGTPGTPLGAWGGLDPSTGGIVEIVFVDNQHVVIAQTKGDATGQAGFEWATYTLDSASGAFTTNVLTDTNGEWGFSHVFNQKITVSADGNTATYTATDTGKTVPSTRTVPRIK
ncbi:hypothetical protein OR1_02377 [Geobacter sp. OR-1]|uniref:beta strand repeat-containing protein n=1 Tax=Geobacter sp. OR-1 TaxID=1266765 RepID=UPI0005426ECA|nr:hypothetical protein [Geobacter sp. OR-1]GAM10090.1 hypothetical protein OR1_02377 [Geobacter sp. OR-1]